MTDVTIGTLDGRSATIPSETIETLRGSLHGVLCLPGEDGYDEARTLWNAMTDRRPSVIIRCAGAGDVVRGVNLARENGLLLAVRGGGHNIAGNAVCDDGLMLDLTNMKSVRVDLANNTVRVEPGVTLGEMDRETQAFALAVPVGVNSTTGVGGLTLGGGFGWLTRKHGMTIDNLISADVVTADGRLVRASAAENEDLFWAIRGGGGNFGVVTSFEFQAHPVGPEVLSGLIVHPLEEARDLLPKYRELAINAPDELTCWVVLRQAPPLPFLPEEWHGKDVLVFALCYAGDMAEGEKATAAIRALGNPIADVVSPHPFHGWQAAFDPLLTPGARNYWKSHDLVQLADEPIDILMDAVANVPSPECEVFIAHVGGAMSKVADDATAYPQRQAHFIMNVHTRWQEAAQDAECIAWARGLFDAITPHAVGSVYVNFMPDDEGDRVAGAYGGNYDRLARIKAQWDPDNQFRMNHNIQPAKVPESVG
jgi:FAD/FMN-containing dehydrogenase